MSSFGPAPPAGWYADPQDHRLLRWWDGSRWTLYTANPPFPNALSAQTAYDAERSLFPWLRWAFVAYPIFATLNFVASWTSAPRWRTYLHWMREVIDHPDLSRTLPRPATPTEGWIYLIDVFIFGSQIVLLIWQYRAAVAARELGYPARRSPGWGVGSWFVPVVNIWMPYQAIRDCLPPGHSARPLVLLTWLLLLGSVVVGLVFTLTLAFWPGLSSYFFALYVAVIIGAALGLYRVVIAIDEQHRQALSS